MPTAGTSCPDHCPHRPGSSPLQHTAIQSWRVGSLLKFEQSVWADALNHEHRIRSFRLLMQHGDNGRFGGDAAEDKGPCLTSKVVSKELDPLDLESRSSELAWRPDRTDAYHLWEGSE